MCLYISCYATLSPIIGFNLATFSLIGSLIYLSLFIFWVNIAKMIPKLCFYYVFNKSYDQPIPKMQCYKILQIYITMSLPKEYCWKKIKVDKKIEFGDNI